MIGLVAAGKQSAKDGRLLEERRKIGAFYTPEALSQILSDWAIRSASDSVLEPSFGGCGFLQSAHERLISLGCREPRKRIYGCDIDPIAFDYLADIFQGPVDLERFIQNDFLQIEPGAPWPETFSCVLANPPYIPYQELGPEQRKRLSQTRWMIEGVGGRASLWAYFIAHAIAFLADGGRMAWVLPGAFLQADYAKPIREFLATSFKRVAAIVVRERIFLEVGADEETAILLADGFRSDNSASNIELGHVETLEGLADLIKQWDMNQWSGISARGRPALLSMSKPELELFDEVTSLRDCKRFGDIASVQIGLVTGANQFFVLSDSGLKTAGLEESDCTPILAKFAAAPGIRFTLTDHLRFLKEGGRGYLVDSDGTNPNERIRTYLNTFPEDQRARTSTFQKRRIWSKPNDGRVPDAFFPVMHHSGPRLILNPFGITNTNTIHRVYFNADSKEIDRRRTAISLLTSFSQLSAELAGRRYGSGVLKHEPREAEQIQLLMPPIDDKVVNEAFTAIDRDLRAKNGASAMHRADKLVYGASGLSNSVETGTQLLQALERVRRRRRPKRN